MCNLISSYSKFLFLFFPQTKGRNFFFFWSWMKIKFCFSGAEKNCSRKKFVLQMAHLCWADHVLIDTRNLRNKFFYNFLQKRNYIKFYRNDPSHLEKYFSWHYMFLVLFVTWWEIGNVSITLSVYDACQKGWV